MIVQSTKNAEQIVVEAYSDDWPDTKPPVTTVTITTKKVELRTEQ